MEIFDAIYLLLIILLLSVVKLKERIFKACYIFFKELPDIIQVIIISSLAIIATYYLIVGMYYLGVFFIRYGRLV